MLSYIVNCILVFMYIFSFKIYSIIDSAIIVGAILGIYFLISSDYRKEIFKYIRTKETIKIGICMILIALLSSIITIINKAYDFTYIITFVNLIINVAIGYGLIIYLKYKNNNQKIVNYIIIGFIVQTCLQWIFFLFPDFSKLFNCLRSQSMIDGIIKYSGRKGIAITTSGFFSLSSTYGLVFILYFTKYNTLFKNNILKVAVFLFLITGTFFAGRTGFIALAFVMVLLLLNIKDILKIKISKKNIIKNLVSIIICVMLFAGFIFFTMKNEKFNNLYSYTFELFKNTLSGKGATTTSTDKLIEMYDIDLSKKAILIGEGKYTDVDDNGVTIYYKQTDVGYFRKLLYFGSLGLILSIVLQVTLFRNFKDKKIMIIILLYMFTLELKGEIIGFNIMFNTIIVLISGLFLKLDKVGEEE